MTPSGSGSPLVESARRVLEDGPRDTLDLAREVLDLRGHPGAAAQAVFTLLGGDPRFRVDREGVWSLDREAEACLSALSYAVVDVETTGYAWERGGRITEIAVVHVEGGLIRSSWESLVNPEAPIPGRIQSFTGITDEMVRAAPVFEGVAPIVADRVSERVFVAHNVRFDWSFVRQELLATIGDAPRVRRLCTARIGRHLFPELPSHGLDTLTARFGIPNQARHRALGDAMATARLLVHLLREAEARGIPDLSSLRAALRPARRKSQRRRSPQRSLFDG